HLGRDDMRERGLAEARRTEQQHVIERLFTRLRRGDEHLELAARRLLADIVTETRRPQALQLGGFFRFDFGGGNETVGFDHKSYYRRDAEDAESNKNEKFRKRW